MIITTTYQLLIELIVGVVPLDILSYLYICQYNYFNVVYNFIIPIILLYFSYSSYVF